MRPGRLPGGESPQVAVHSDGLLGAVHTAPGFPEAHVPEFLVVSEGDAVSNLMDYGITLGRRFRALKLWFVIRNFGVDGLRSLIREHIRIARRLGEWIDDDPELERMAVINFSTVVFRHCPPGMKGRDLDQHNASLLEKVIAGREVYLSHTRVGGSYALRIAIGNIHTTEAHVKRALALVREAAGSGTRL